MSNDAQRVLDQLFCTSKAVPNAYPQVTKDQCGQNIGARLGNCCSIAEAGNNKSFTKPRPRILQPHFLSKEGKFILETNHRLIKTEQVHKPGKIQNGDHRVNQSDITAKRLGRFHRPKGCLLSHSGGKEAPKVSPVYPQRSCISICSPPIRVVHRSNDIHPCHEIMLHKINVEIHMYLDDWLLRAKSQALLQRNLNVTLDLCEQLGLEVNVAKSELIPTQKFTFLGYRYNTNSGMVYPPQARVEDLITLVSQVQKQRPTVRKMMSLLGLMSSAEKVIPWGRLHMRELQADLHGQWRRGESLESQIVLTPPSRADLQWWKEDSNLVAGLPLHPPTPQIELFTDSSTEGWGAHTESKTGSVLWSQEEKFLHINVLEMRAAHLAIRYFSQSLRNKIVLLASDNTSVVWYLKKNKGGRNRGTCSSRPSTYSARSWNWG